MAEINTIKDLCMVKKTVGVKNNSVKKKVTKQSGLTKITEKNSSE